MKLSFNHLVFISLLFLVASCARRGSITGGPKDTLAPVLKNSIPKNFSTRFTGKEIQLTFDEYVKLKNVNKQLVFSTPLEKEPEILPFTPSKTISIRFKEDLKPNTTYSLNFGQSIEDRPPDAGPAGDVKRLDEVVGGERIRSWSSINGMPMTRPTHDGRLT